MPQSSQSFDRLDQAQVLLEDLEERKGRGEQASLEELIASHPALEAELRELAQACAEVREGFSEAASRARGAREEFERLLGAVSSPRAFSERYAIESEVGKGGMGAVYRIVDKKLSRPLAMKVILGQAEAGRSGETPQVSPRQLSRFLNEAKITSQLDHPGIVPVHEVGVDEEGRAYFTMKLVQGKTLGEVFELNRRKDPAWAMPKVLGVIQRVCEAVAFAHEREVIHRDLKPLNVMVGEFGEVYVMDWGLARRLAAEAEQVEASDATDAVDEQLAAQVSLTREGRVVGTPCYMSPEQARGDIARMGPQSDVYAIGAMLYELAAGAPPYMRVGEQVSSHEILARIEAGPPDRLRSRSLAPELVAVLEKAMSYEPASRYPSVRNLGEDLELFLGGRTVRALKVGAWVELRKWVRRNKGLSFGLAAAMLAILVGAIGILVKNKALVVALADSRLQKGRADEQAAAAQSNEARARESELVALAREKDANESRSRADTVSEFVQRALTAADPNQEGEQNVTVGESMDRAISDLERGTLRETPSIEAALLQTIARILNGNGKHAQALPLAERALAMRQTMFAQDHADVAESLATLGSCLASLGRFTESLRMHEQALTMRRRLFGPDHADVLASLSHVASCLGVAGKNADALPLHMDAIAIGRRLSATDDRDVALSLGNAASCLDALGRSGEAQPLHREGLQMRRRIFEGDHPEVAAALANLATCLLQLGKFDEALAAQSESLEMHQRLFRGDHPAVAMCWHNLGRGLQALGREPEALEAFRRSLDMRRALLPEDDVETAKTLCTIGTCLGLLGFRTESLQFHDEGYWILKSLYGLGHPSVAVSLNDRAICLQSLGRTEDALAAYAEALEITRCLFPDDLPTEATTLSNIGFCLLNMKRADDALQSFTEALAIQRQIFDPVHPAIATTLSNSASALRAIKRIPEAIRLNEEALAIRMQVYPGEHPEVVLSLNNLARCLLDAGSVEEARMHSERSNEMAEQCLDEGHPWRQACANTLAEIRKRARQE